MSRTPDAPLQTLTVRLETGTEYWYSEQVPRDGDTIHRLGREYVVTRVDADGEHVVVTVEPVGTSSSGDGAGPADV
jgi:hypothetical protein